MVKFCEHGKVRGWQGMSRSIIDSINEKGASICYRCDWTEEFVD